MRMEADLRDDDPTIVEGIKGVRSKHFRRRFLELGAALQWIERNQDDIEVISIHRAD